MVLNIFALLFVLGVTFVHSIFGLYSALLNVMCAIIALAVAFGCYEPLNALLTGEFHLHPSYTEPGALVLLFAVTLIILRTLSDKLLRGNVRVPAWLDWGGGAAVGFVVAQICVGVMVVSFLMLPWGGRTLMFSRYERELENKTWADALDVDPQLKKQDERVAFYRRNLWLRSDEFAVGLFNILSQGSLSGGTTLASVYPDFAEWVFWTGNTVQPESFTAPIRDDKGDGVKNGLKVQSWWEQKTPLAKEFTRYRRELPDHDKKDPPYQPLDYKVQEGHKLLGVHLVLDRSAADRDKEKAYHRFRPSMIRLVGDVRQPDGADAPAHYIAQVVEGLDTKLGDNLRIADLDNNFGASGGTPVDVRVYFEVPNDFKPRFVEYRRHARAAIVGEPAKTPPAARLAAGPAAGARGGAGGDRGSGAARFIASVDRSASGDNPSLPFPVKIDRLRTAMDVTLEGRLVASGRFQGDKEGLAAPDRERDANVAAVKPPDGQRIFQLATKARQAQSLAGQVMNFAGATVNQYQVEDDTGASYPLIGYYAVVKRDGKEFIEFAYFPDDPSFRGMLDFKTSGIRKDLQDQDDAVLGMLFAVPPGKKIVAVSSQGGRVEFGTTFTMGT